MNRLQTAILVTIASCILAIELEPAVVQAATLNRVTRAGRTTASLRNGSRTRQERDEAPLYAEPPACSGFMGERGAVPISSSTYLVVQPMVKGRTPTTRVEVWVSHVPGVPASAFGWEKAFHDLPQGHALFWTTETVPGPGEYAVSVVIYEGERQVASWETSPDCYQMVQFVRPGTALPPHRAWID